jgi:hypothetical protein
VVIVVVVAIIAGGVTALWFWGPDVPYVDDDEPAETGGAPGGGTALATVAVEPDDTIQRCFERNLTPALLLSLYREDTTLSDTVIRACLETQIPSEIVELGDPIIQETSRCASRVSRTLTTEDVLVLGQEPGVAETEKRAIIKRVAIEIVRCVARTYELPV